MKILLFGVWPNLVPSLWFGWALHLSKMGHKVEFWPRYQICSSDFDAFWSVAQECDILLTYKGTLRHSEDGIPLAWVEKFKDTGRPTVWFTDDDPQKHFPWMMPGHNSDRYIRTALSHDFQFTCCYYSVDFWNGLGGQAYFLPLYFYSPYLFRPLMTASCLQRHDVLFVGSPYTNAPTRPQRIDCLKAAIDAGLDVVVGGPPEWRDIVGEKRYIGKISWGYPLAEQYTAAKTVLCDIYVDGTITPRYWEALLSRTVVLGRNTAHLTKLLTPGEHFDVWETVSEFVSKAMYYSQNDSSRERVASCGMDKARLMYTCDQYFQSIFRTIGLWKQPSLLR